MLRVLTPHFEHLYLTRFNSPRAAVPEQIAALLPEGTSFSEHQAAIDSLSAARAAAGPEDLVCVAGSVFLAGELRAEFGHSNP